MSRTSVRHRRLAVTVSVALIGAAWAGPALRALGSPSEPTRVARAAYLVREGDTLWSIAKHLSPAQDPRRLVDALTAVNLVDAGHLVPGQVLVLPAST